MHHATLIKLYQMYTIACCPNIQLQNSPDLSAVANFQVQSMCKVVNPLTAGFPRSAVS